MLDKVRLSPVHVYDYHNPLIRYTLKAGIRALY
jgi:hypothetical protein